ncbi:MAG: hypothetical protein AAFU71_13655 [Cyanobacteria bacterium J06632_22]
MELSQRLSDRTIRHQIAQDCTHLIDQQVSAKGGLGGFAIKAAYGVVKGIGADYVPGAVGRLLPEALSALDPVWAEGEQAGDPVQYLSNHRDLAADVILGVTDARIAKSSNKVITGAYGKLRKSIQGDVAEAVPGLAEILQNRLAA